MKTIKHLYIGFSPFRESITKCGDEKAKEEDCVLYQEEVTCEKCLEKNNA